MIKHQPEDLIHNSSESTKLPESKIILKNDVVVRR